MNHLPFWLPTVPQFDINLWNIVCKIKQCLQNETSLSRNNRHCLHSSFCEANYISTEWGCHVVHLLFHFCCVECRCQQQNQYKGQHSTKTKRQPSAAAQIWGTTWHQNPEAAVHSHTKIGAKNSTKIQRQPSAAVHKPGPIMAPKPR